MSAPSQKTTECSKSMADLLSTFAYHVSILTETPAPARFRQGLSAGGVMRIVEVVVLPKGVNLSPDSETVRAMFGADAVRRRASTPPASADIWDGVWMRDANETAPDEWRWYGNRSGGRDGYATAMAPVFEACARAFMTEGGGAG